MSTVNIDDKLIPATQMQPEVSEPVERIEHTKTDPDESDVSHETSEKLASKKN